MSNAIDLNLTQHSINNSLWDEAISVIGKFMENSKIYTNLMQALYEAHQQYKQLQAKAANLNTHADYLQAELNKLQLKTPGKQKSKKLLPLERTELKAKIAEIDQMRQQAKQLSEQSVLSLYQNMPNQKKEPLSFEVSAHSDFKYFTRSLHYNYATSNRDELGNEATAAINMFFKHKQNLGPQAAITSKLLEIYTAFTNAAADKEKCLAASHAPIGRSDYLKYISEAKNHPGYLEHPSKLVDYMHDQHKDVFGKTIPHEDTKTRLNIYYDRAQLAYEKLNEFSKVIRDTCANHELIATLKPEEKAAILSYQRFIADFKKRCEQEIKALDKAGIISMKQIMESEAEPQLNSKIP